MSTYSNVSGATAVALLLISATVPGCTDAQAPAGQSCAGSVPSLYFEGFVGVGAAERVAGSYRNESTEEVLQLDVAEGCLDITLTGGAQEGLLAYADDRASDQMRFNDQRAQELMTALIDGDDDRMLTMIGGQWYGESSPTDTYVNYFKRTYRDIHGPSARIKTFRVLGTRMKDEWTNHGNSENGWAWETTSEVVTATGDTVYTRFAWDPETSLAAGFGIGTFLFYGRDRLRFLPRSPTKYVAYDVINDKTISVSFQDEPAGIVEETFMDSEINHLMLGSVRFDRTR
jgi:hypothetical protein